MAERRPGLVPDDALRGDPVGPADVTAGFDTDGDGRADTVVTDDGIDLVVHTDLDGDGFADQVLRIGPDAGVRELAPRPPSDTHAVLDGMWAGIDMGFEPPDTP